jgi:hypothetical protein
MPSGQRSTVPQPRQISPKAVCTRFSQITSKKKVPVFGMSFFRINLADELSASERKRLQPRVRRALLGMMLHVDRSDHAWFQDERRHELMVILDDAISEIYYAHLVDRPLVSITTRNAAMTLRVDSASSSYTAIAPGSSCYGKARRACGSGASDTGGLGAARDYPFNRFEFSPVFLESLQNKAKTGIDLWAKRPVTLLLGLCDVPSRLLVAKIA